MKKRWIAFILMQLAILLLAVSAGAQSNQVNETINIEAAIGDEIYYEFYRDNNYVDGVAFVAKRDGGNHPDWGDIIFNSFEYGNPRTAYIKTTAKTAGEWSFRAGVFETPNMSKQEKRIYTVQVNIRVRAAGSNSNSGSTATSFGVGYVLCESLSVRMEPNITSNVIASFAHGLTFNITAVDQSWYKVNYDGTIGWVNGQYVLVNPQYYTAQSEKAVYAYPGANALRIGLIDANTRLAIIADLQDYYCVSIRGASGFIQK